MESVCAAGMGTAGPAEAARLGAAGSEAARLGPSAECAGVSGDKNYWGQAIEAQASRRGCMGSSSRLGAEYLAEPAQNTIRQQRRISCAILARLRRIVPKQLL